MNLFSIGLDLVSMLMTFVIFISLVFDKDTSLNREYPIALIIHVLTVISDLAYNVLEKEHGNLLFIKITVILIVTFSLYGITGFSYYVDNMVAKFLKKKTPVRFVIFIIASILLTIWANSLGNKFMFSLDSSGNITLTKACWLFAAFLVAIMLFNLVRVINYHVKGRFPLRVCVGLYLFIFIVLIASVAVYLTESVSVLFAGVSIGYLTIYLAIHGTDEKDKKTEERGDSEVQVELIFSQLQPHFIFNTLTVIKYLCGTNSVLADEATGIFSKYLRHNFESIKAREYVPFSQEVEHIKNYIWLEKLRFNEYIRVKYSIDTDEFKIPALSVQPIVENAIRHGITKKMGGGTVNIMVREHASYYRIVIEDTGLGFDTNILKSDEMKYKSIAGISERLRRMNGSTLEVKSHKDDGTIVTIKIFKTEKGA